MTHSSAEPVPTLQIVIKDKSTESVLQIHTTPISKEELIKSMKLMPQETMVIEDENHNVISSNIISPPIIVFVCRFVPNNKGRKRRNVVSELIPVASQSEKCKENTAIVI